MKHTLFLSMLAAVFLGSGVAEAAGTLNASDYYSGSISLGNGQSYDMLVVNKPLTLQSLVGLLDIYNGATIEFRLDSSAESICSIFTSAGLPNDSYSLYFNNSGDTYNFSFNEGAQAIVAASAGKAITLIQDLNMRSKGFSFYGGISPSDTTLKLNGAGYNETVVLDGVSFTYVGPKDSDYPFQAGEIGFTGYYEGSHTLSLVAKAAPTPEPTTGSLSLLALAGLCARRRRK